MHQEGCISVFSDILYDDHSPSVGPRGSTTLWGTTKGYTTPWCCNDNSRKGIIKYSILFHVLVG